MAARAGRCGALAALGLASLGLSACTKLEYESCQLACGPELSCPAELACERASNRCLRAGEDAFCPADRGCAPGFEPSPDGERCQDVDACADDNGGCMHICQEDPTPGEAARCDCRPGFTLAEDGKSCRCPPSFVEDEEGRVCRCGGPGTAPLPALSGALSLWLDAETLPAPDSPLIEWCDRSGLGHHALPRTVAAAPALLSSRVEDERLGLDLDPNEWLEVRPARGERAHQVLPFAARDFYLMLLGKLSDPGVPSSICLFTNAVSSSEVGLVLIQPSRERDVSVLVPGIRTAEAPDAATPLQIRAAPNTAPLDGLLHQYALWRRGDLLELRVDGAMVGSALLPAGHDLDGLEAPVIGTCSNGGSSLRALLHAVVMISAPSQDDVDALEAYFR